MKTTKEKINGYQVTKGVIWWGQDEMGGGLAWILIGGKVTEDEALNIAVKAGLDVGRYYGGPGREFHSEAGIRYGKYKTLVTQYFGMDI